MGKLTGVVCALISSVLLLFGVVGLLGALVEGSADTTTIIVSVAMCAMGTALYKLAKVSFEPRQDSKPKEKARPSPIARILFQFVGGVLGFFGIVALLVYAGVRLDLGKPETNRSVRSTEQAPTSIDAGTISAWAYIQQFVLAELDAPSSSDFPFGGHRDVRALGEGRYSVDSFVEVKNGVGTTVKTSFSATVKSVPGGWELEKLEFSR